MVPRIRVLPTDLYTVYYLLAFPLLLGLRGHHLLLLLLLLLGLSDEVRGHLLIFFGHSHLLVDAVALVEGHGEAPGVPRLDLHGRIVGTLAIGPADHPALLQVQGIHI